MHNCEVRIAELRSIFLLSVSFFSACTQREGYAQCGPGFLFVVPKVRKKRKDNCGRAKLRLAGDVSAFFSAVAAILAARSLILRFLQFGVALSMGQPCKRAGVCRGRT